MKGYRQLRNHILEDLANELSPNLLYHGFHHTMDVLNVVNGYLRRYKMKGREAILLRIGALAHDIGFVNTYRNHEEEGVKITRELMKHYGFSNKDIQVVEGLIMATKVPQKPKNKLEEIICDADLDYLGRDDFDPISESLFQELKLNDMVKDRNTWNKIQIDFLQQHQYHTEFARRNRQPVKEMHLEGIKQVYRPT